ncbi:MAG: hypothetical protein HQL69_03620 [Magnetococcales bacterium]|nr:hypothetical protein [Magnetococcales bacterium]
MTMNGNLHDVDLGQQQHETNQTIFLATRMDLMAHIMPKREKPKKGFAPSKHFLNPSDLQQKPTIH